MHIRITSSSSYYKLIYSQVIFPNFTCSDIFLAFCTSGRKLRSQTQVANYAKQYKCFA